MVLTYLREFFLYSYGQTAKNHKNVRTVGNQAKIRTGYVQNTRVES